MIIDILFGSILVLLFLMVLDLGFAPLFTKVYNEYHRTNEEIPDFIPLVNFYYLCYYKYQIHKRKNVRYKNK